MAFGVVVAGTGALSGTGGQKRYRVNRFRREIYRFGWAFRGVDWGTCNRNHRDIDYSILSRVYMRHIYRVRVCVCMFIVVHSWRPFRGASLFLSESPVTDRRFLPSR